MIWRLFKGRSTTTKEVTSSNDGGQAGEVRELERSQTSPSMNAFKFESTTTTTKRVEADTAVDVPRTTEPAGDFATVVREKSRRRRGVRVADRGVTPILIPSLQETSVRLKAIATSLGGRKPSEAAEYWKAYLRLCPADSEGWFVCGRCLLVSGAEAEAEVAFRRTVDVDHQHSLGWAALAYIAERRESLDEATMFYARSVEFDRDNVELLTEYARLLNLTGDIQTAELVQEKLEEIHQGNG